MVKANSSLVGLRPKGVGPLLGSFLGILTRIHVSFGKNSERQRRHGQPGIEPETSYLPVLGAEPGIHRINDFRYITAYRRIFFKVYFNTQCSTYNEVQR